MKAAKEASDQEGDCLPFSFLIRYLLLMVEIVIFVENLENKLILNHPVDSHCQLLCLISVFLKMHYSALAGVAQWIECQPAH